MRASKGTKVQSLPPINLKLKHQATAEVRPFFKTDNLGEASLVENWKQVAIDKLGEIVQSDRAIRVFLDSCVKCGACTDKCHYFLGNKDPKNMPVARQDLIRGVYRRYFTTSGRLFPSVVGAVDLTEELLQQWATYYYQCSECRRCSVFCPFGIDTAEITMAGRSILDSVGLAQKYIHQVMDKGTRFGNNLGMVAPAIIDTLETLEEEIYEDTGTKVRLPVDESGAEVLFVVPSADFYAEPHVDGLIGCAKIFHQTGVSWTLSTVASEASNFGLFVADDSYMQQLAERIYFAALELGVNQIVIGECGHAWRVASSYWEKLMQQNQTYINNPISPRHICELTDELLERGSLKLDQSVHEDKVVTFHDSCNVARASSMGKYPQDVYQIPRRLLRASCATFVDMAADSIREKTFCCGGGGGLLTDELMEIRIHGASPRVRALEHVISSHGVTHMAAICAICKSQFRSVLPHYGLGDDMIVSLHQLIGDAVILQ